MSYIFFDLEWNQGYPRNDTEKLDEIIQLGAVRLDDFQAECETFSAYVRPTIHRKLHHRVKSMLPLDQKALSRAQRFPSVISDFFAWCGEGAMFFTWGPSDARVLDINLAWYGLEEYLSLEIYDLQRAFDAMILETDQQTSLKDAVEALGLSSLLEFHDAGNDAYYTAMICREMIRRLGELPSEEALLAQERALYARRRNEAKAEAGAAIDALRREQTPILEKDCGSFAEPGACLRSRAARVFQCPQCDSWLCNGNWYQLGQDYVSRSRCVEHGRFYTLLRLVPSGEQWHGSWKLYPETEFPPALFSRCKLGGEAIVVRKLPKKRKRHRTRKKTVSLKVTPAPTAPED